MKFPSNSYGNPNNEIIIFLAGFPDNQSCGFEPIIKALKEHYYCISLCLPGLEEMDEEYYKRYRLWHYDFDELDDILHETIGQYVPHDSKKKFSFVLHDWGSVVGMRYQNKYPNNISKLIVLDVGIVYIPEIAYIFHFMLYQMTFGFSYMVSQLINWYIGNIIFKAFLLLIYKFRFLHPVPYDKIHRPFHDINVNMCYLYFYAYMHFFCGKFIMPNFPNCPILFMVTYKYIFYCYC